MYDYQHNTTISVQFSSSFSQLQWHMSQFRPRLRGTSNIIVSLSLDPGASHSSRHDMLAIISSRYQYGPFLFFVVAEVVKLLDYWRAEKNFSLLSEPPWGLRPVAFATSATWLIRHCGRPRPACIVCHAFCTDVKVLHINSLGGDVTLPECQHDAE